MSSTRHAWVSQHIGDMENLDTLEAFEACVGHFGGLYDVTPDVVAIDAHPGYVTSRWGRDNHLGRLRPVQHHHAHVAAVMAEHQLDPAQPVIGFAFDGTGYGDDGTIWGGEVLIADANGYDRFAHLAPVPLPGGDAAIANPYRVALAHLHAAAIPWTPALAPVAQLDEVEHRVLRRQLDRRVGCVSTTSMGRLFDAVASLLGLRHRISFEAQAAIDLEIAAERAGARSGSFRFGIDDGVVATTDVIGAVVADLAQGHPVELIAYRFHVAVAQMTVDLAQRARSEHGRDTVVLSGGVFQNALLTTLCTAGLAAAGFRTLTHRVVPPNDGGLALGQAYIAAHCAEPDGNM